MTTALGLIQGQTFEVLFPEEQEDCCPTTRSPASMPVISRPILVDLIDRVATKLDYQESPSDIRKHLVNEVGMNNNDAYLTFIAGKMIHTERSSDAMINNIRATRLPRNGKP